MTALIDGDILIYTIGHASQTNIYRFKFYDERPDFYFPVGNTKSYIIKLLNNPDNDYGFTSEDGILESSIQYKHFNLQIHQMNKLINSILDGVNRDTYRLFLTSDDHSNFRYDIAKTKPYKANRGKKPVYYNELRGYLIVHWNAEVVRGQEADDAIGINMDVEFYQNPVIVSTDKDLDQIPGTHYNFKTGKLYEIEDGQSLELSSNRRKLTGGGYAWFYAQMLMGDSTDNIPGISGCGPVNTYKLLKDCKTELDYMEKVWSVYKNGDKDLKIKGVSEDVVKDRFLEVADLLWIRRKDNEKKSEEISWLSSCEE